MEPSRRTGRVVVLAACVAPIALVAACDEPTVPALKAGLVGEGNFDDHTYNRLVYDGCVRAAEDFGLELDFAIAPPGASAGYIDGLAATSDHVVTISFLMGDATRAAALAHPDVHFAILDYQYTDYPPNLSSYQFREDQGGYLAGTVAGLVVAGDPSPDVACLGGLEIPAIKRFCNGFAHGARRVCPGCATPIRFTSSFDAPDEGIAAADELIAQGADVIFGAGGFTGSAGIHHAAGRGVWVIGVDQDEFFSTFGGGADPGAPQLLTSLLKRTDRAAYASIRSTRLGTFAPGAITLATADGAFDLAPYHATAERITPSMQAEIDRVLAGLRDGTLDTGVDPQTGDPIAAAPGAGP